MDAALTALEGTITLPAMSAASALRASKGFLRGLSAYCLVRDGRLNEALIALERSRASSSLRAAGDVPLASLLERIPVGVTAVLPLVTEHGTAVFLVPHGLSQIESAHVLLTDTFDDRKLANVLVSSSKPDGTTAPGWLHALGAWRERANGPGASLAALRNLERSFGTGRWRPDRADSRQTPAGHIHLVHHSPPRAGRIAAARDSRQRHGLTDAPCVALRRRLRCIAIRDHDATPRPCPGNAFPPHRQANG